MDLKRAVINYSSLSSALFSSTVFNPVFFLFVVSGLVFEDLISLAVLVWLLFFGLAPSSPVSNLLFFFSTVVAALLLVGFL